MLLGARVDEVRQLGAGRALIPPPTLTISGLLGYSFRMSQNRTTSFHAVLPGLLSFAFVASCGHGAAGGDAGGGLDTGAASIAPISSQGRPSAPDESVEFAHRWADGGLVTYGRSASGGLGQSFVALHHGDGDAIDWAFEVAATYVPTSAAGLGRAQAWFAFARYDAPTALVVGVDAAGARVESTIALPSAGSVPVVTVDGPGAAYLALDSTFAALAADAQPVWAYATVAGASWTQAWSAADPAGGLFAGATAADGALVIASIARDGTLRYERSISADSGAALAVEHVLPAASGHRCALVVRERVDELGRERALLVRVDATGNTSVRQLFDAASAPAVRVLAIEGESKGYLVAQFDGVLTPNAFQLTRLDAQNDATWTRTLALAQDDLAVDVEGARVAAFRDGGCAVLLPDRTRRLARIVRISSFGGLTWSRDLGAIDEDSAVLATTTSSSASEPLERSRRADPFESERAALGSLPPTLVARADGGVIARVAGELGDVLCGLNYAGGIDWRFDARTFRLDTLIPADAQGALFAVGETSGGDPLVLRFDRNPPRTWAARVPSSGTLVRSTDAGAVLASTSGLAGATDLAWYAFDASGSTDAACVVAPFELTNADLASQPAAQAFAAIQLSVTDVLDVTPLAWLAPTTLASSASAEAAATDTATVPLCR